MTQAIRMLLAEGLITREQYETAISRHSLHGGTPGYHLVADGSISAERLASFLVKRFPMTHWPKKRLAQISPDLTGLLSSDLARSLRVIPLVFNGQKVVLGVTDPSNTSALRGAAEHMRRKIEPAIVTEDDMSWALEKYYDTSKPTPERASVEPEPIPLVKKITKDINPSAYSRGSRDTSVMAEGESIEDAIMAIPLVNRIPSKKRGDSTKPRLFSKPAVTTEKKGKVDAVKPVIIRDKAPEAAVDSWSRPVGESTKSVTDFTPTPTKEKLDGKLKRLPSNPPREKSDQIADASAIATEQAERKLTEGELIAAINRATSRDEIIDLTLQSLSRFAGRAIFMTVKRNEIRGFSVFGDLTNRDAARTFWVPSNTPSTLSRVANRRQIHIGPLDDTPADAVLSASLGGMSESAVIIPVVLNNRTIAVLFADRLEVKLPPRHRLEKLASTIAENLGKLIKAGR